MKRIHSLIALLFMPALTMATTWDEPWMFDVISDADSFVKVDVTDNTPEGFTAKVTKHLAGEKTPSEIKVTNYYLLSFSSFSVNETDFRFNPDTDYYLFLKKGEKEGEYSIATPTTGWAKIIEQVVNATYRHSYHQALVHEDVYEMSMAGIFQSIHNIDHDESEILKFVSLHLNRSPALLSKAGENPEVADEFFNQHVALELFRFYGTAEDMKLIEPFLSADDYHVQISAVRSIGLLDTVESNEKLMQFIEGKHFGFAKVMAVWALAKNNTRDFRPRLEKFLIEGEDEKVGFGGSIMDPRVGTSFPYSLKEAISHLLEKWNEK